MIFALLVSIAAQDAGSFVFAIDNDAFLFDDSHFTQGMQAQLLLRAPGTSWVTNVEDTLTQWTTDKQELSYGFTIGQTIYTPNDIRRSSIDVDDRPYGGWLWLGLVARSAGYFHVFDARVRAGPTGAASGAAEIQRGWHAILRGGDDDANPPDPKGWPHQIAAGPGFQLSARTTHRLPLLSWFDAAATTRTDLGLPFDTVGAGARLRIGKLPLGAGDYDSDYPVRNAVAVDADRDTFEWSAHGFAEGSARVVLYNALIQGMPFAANVHTVEPLPFVFDGFVGVGGFVDWFVFRAAVGATTAETATSKDVGDPYWKLDFGCRF